MRWRMQVPGRRPVGRATAGRARAQAAVTAGALAAALAGTLWAHDMFLKLPSFFLEPHAEAEVHLLNGTFDRSENVITRDRMLDVRVVGPDGAVRHPGASAWRDSAVHAADPDSADTAILGFRTGEPGTYVIGVSTRPRVLSLSAEDFNAYLEHDGVLDALERRRLEGRLEEPAVERYSKHVKAAVQVGERRTEDAARAFGYPAEFVPLANPYGLAVGEALEVRFLRDGRPVPDQLVYASHEEHGAHDAEGGHDEAVSVRTDADGVARIPLSRVGKWYVRAIHMAETPGEEDVDYESNWATLTFEVR